MKTLRRMALACGFFLIPILLSPAWAGEGSGQLDRRFGIAGKVLTDFTGGSAESANALAIQSDGKIVAGGEFNVSGTSFDFALTRYKSKGRLDHRFGTHGKVLTDFSGSESVDFLHALAIQSDGRIVAAGYSNSDFALARYNPDGTLDNTFNGTGKVLTDFSGSGSFDGAEAVAIQADGKIVALGHSDASGTLDFALARYNPDGTLDNTFNGTGKVLTDEFFRSGSFDVAEALAIQADGKIVAAGNSTPRDEGYAAFALARYNPDGTLDNTFNGTGKVITEFSGLGDRAFALAIQADGKIVAAGNSSGDFALARYNPDGTLDITFNGTGKVLTDFSGSGSSNDSALALAIQSDGKIVAAGRSDASGTLDFALARYNP